MGWDIELINPDTGSIVEVDPHTEGSTYAIGGTTAARLTVTYNYHQFGFGELDGKTARDTIPTLGAVVNELGVEQDADYWAPTPGNAGHACSVLLGWARQHPDAVWDVW